MIELIFFFIKHDNESAQKTIYCHPEKKLGRFTFNLKFIHTVQPNLILYFVWLIIFDHLIGCNGG